MAHHSPSSLGEHWPGPKLGATGRFPEGKLVEHDMGEIQMRVGLDRGKIVIDFGTPTAWVGMTPQQASDMADSLVKFSLLARGIS